MFGEIKQTIEKKKKRCDDCIKKLNENFNFVDEDGKKQMLETKNSWEKKLKDMRNEQDLMKRQAGIEEECTNLATIALFQRSDEYKNFEKLLSKLRAKQDDAIKSGLDEEYNQIEKDMRYLLRCGSCRSVCM